MSVVCVLLGGYFYGNNKYEGFNKKICEWQ